MEKITTVIYCNLIRGIKWLRYSFQIPVVENRTWRFPPLTSGHRYRTILTVILMCTVFYSGAQSLFISVEGESTIQGLYYGTAVNLQVSKRFSAGLFVHEHLRTRAENQFQDHHSFKGVSFLVSPFRSKRMSADITLRCGLLNEDFVVVIPSVQTTLSITKRIALVAGSGLRSNCPSFYSNIQFKIF